MEECFYTLNEYLDNAGISISKMSKDTGIPYNTCRRIRKAENSPLIENFFRIVKTYPFINANHIANKFKG